MRILLIIIALAVSCIGLYADTKEIADRYFDLLQKGKYKKCFKMSSADMQKALPDEKLQEAWESIPKQIGKYIGTIDYSMEVIDENEVHTYVLNFEKLVMDMRIGINKDQEVSGLFYSISKTPKPDADLTLPDYLNPENAIEKEITFECDRIPINAKLTTPKGYQNFPLVIMLTGSGPNDMDETLYQRKPFRDIALGLANQGVATLRWSKRTLDHPEMLAGNPTFSPRNEYIDEVNAALSWMHDHSIYSHRFILGHSMGAYILPQIALEKKDFRGYIMLAGNARPLEDLVREQYEYIYGLKEMTPEAQAELDKIKQQCLEIKELSENTPVNQPLLLNVPKPYWMWINKYKQMDILKMSSSPFLIMQGEKDYQVSMTDFALWEEVAETRGNITTKSYPILDHLFMPCSGDSTPEKYLDPAFVSQKVILDIADWIKSIDK
jgi:fermentation-respiration switch protein FrsA (DUF1100 family)